MNLTLSQTYSKMSLKGLEMLYVARQPLTSFLKWAMWLGSHLPHAWHEVGGWAATYLISGRYIYIYVYIYICIYIIIDQHTAAAAAVEAAAPRPAWSAARQAGRVYINNVYDFYIYTFSLFVFIFQKKKGSKYISNKFIYTENITKFHKNI